MAMRATTDVKRVCRVERTFHHTCNAFKLPHGTHRRPVSRLVCRSVGRSVGRSCRTLSPLVHLFPRTRRRRRLWFSSRYIHDTKRTIKRTNTRHACTSMHALHTRWGFPRRGKERERRKENEKELPMLRRVAPHRTAPWNGEIRLTAAPRDRP